MSRFPDRRPITGEEETKKIDPILTTPGGWGLRNPVPKGPGQPTHEASQALAAAGGRKSGGIMIFSNDAVRAE
ncbi:hypothetical protein GCM10022626_08740 [[Pseudomonas] carboxydohydrogena]